METQKKEKEIHDLKGRYDPTFLKEVDYSARVFQVTRCSSCGLPLDLPTVHFMCKHSFHQRYPHQKVLKFMVDVFLILMTRSVHNVRKKMPRSEICGDNKTNGQSDKIYFVRISGIQMINSVSLQIGLVKAL